MSRLISMALSRRGKQLPLRTDSKDRRNESCQKKMQL
nr:MAG TPA: hypothetical protein [Caudoviricetes sp.]